MIVDTSAVMAIVFSEADADDFIHLISSERAAMSAASYLECSVVADRAAAQLHSTSASDRRAELGRELDETIADLHLSISAVTRAQADLARAAHREFGPGSGSRARLNIGDCFAYALAKETGRPLLFKGDDFTYTDVQIYRSDIQLPAAESGEPDRSV